MKKFAIYPSCGSIELVDNEAAVDGKYAETLGVVWIKHPLTHKEYKQLIDALMTVDIDKDGELMDRF